MKLRIKYLLFVIILHLVTLVLSFFIFRNDKLIFIASEVLILISALISWQLYYELIQPLKMLMNGADAIEDKDFNVKFVSTGRYEMDKLISVYNRMIDELRTERTKQEQQHFFLEKLIYTSPIGILILDYEENIQQVNPRALDLLNMEGHLIIRKSIYEIAHPVMEQIQQLRTGEAKTIIYNGVATYKLQKSHFIDRGFSRQFIMIEELTAEILAAEKKAYGKVIRMMAHEVNNTIGAVNSILQSTQAAGGFLEEQKNALLHNALKVAIDRNQNLNIFMRNFADLVRLPEPNKKNIDLHKIIHAVAHLMEMRAGNKGIQFEFYLADGSFNITADEQQMEQVLINIVKNGMEAIEDSGTVSFATNLYTRQLTITDTGKGISASFAEQLFSPFFSTKKDGQGIGLTLVKEVLINHGFEFSLKTISAGRTEFIIQF
ncbi:MAG: PAS domain-containing protein [Bacteroidetes bacterium]|nr:PAS domain-containing protein [Bacteroidota bacterium]